MEQALALEWEWESNWGEVRKARDPMARVTRELVQGLALERVLERELRSAQEQALESQSESQLELGLQLGRPQELRLGLRLGPLRK
jgi:hypothetical protein